MGANLDTATDGKGFFVESIRHSNGVSRTAWALLILLLVVFAFCEVINQPFFETHEGTALLVLWLTYIVAVGATIFSMAKQDHHLVVHVVIWSLLSLIVTLAAFYVAFFVVTSNFAVNTSSLIDYTHPPKVDAEVLQQVRTQWSALLSLPPVVLGVWSGLTGLFVHYQTQKKNQRTSNAFSIVIQTRTNQIFSEMSRAKQAAYRHNYEVPAADLEYFKASMARDIPMLKSQTEALRKAFHEIEAGVVTDEKRIADKPLLKKHLDEKYELLCKLEGAAGVRYLLNYYEFMAKGIRAGDLDEDLLFGTLRSTVVSLYQDTVHFRNYARNGNAQHGPNYSQAQPRAFEHLEWLVDRGDSPDGWRKRQ